VLLLVGEKVKKHRKGKKIIFVVAVVMLAAVLGTVNFINGKLNKIVYDNNNVIEYDPDVTFEGEDEVDLSGLTIIGDNGEIVLPQTDVYADRDVLNILLLGTDERTEEFNVNARADSMMLLSLNLKEGTAKLVSLERGVGVPVEGRGIDLLTHTFRYGGAELTMQTVRDCFKVDVDKYVRVNFYMFEKIVDAIGGVDVELTELECLGLNGEVYTNAETKATVTPGLNHLDGYDALQYARLRYIDDDWHRIVRQRNIIQAVVNQTKHLNLLEINEVADTVLPMVMTNLTKSEIASLIFHAPKFLGVEIEQMTVPTYETCWGAVSPAGIKYIGMDFEANAKILQELFYGE